MASEIARLSQSEIKATVADWESKVDLVKRVCCGGKNPPLDAFDLFLHVCKASGLDPLLKEAWLVERRTKNEDGSWSSTWQPMAGRDGYLAAAHRSGVFAGIQTTVYPEDAGKPPTHATCKVWRRDWTEPVITTVAFSEYRDDRSFLWKGKPRTMIAKVAEAHALRRAFSLHGTYTPDEIPEDEPRTVAASAAPSGSVLAGATVTQTQRALPAPPPPVPSDRAGDIFDGVFPDEAKLVESDPVDLEALNQEAEYLIEQTIDEKDRDRARRHWAKGAGLAETAIAALERLRARVGKLITPAQLQKLCAMQSERGIDEEQMRAGLIREFGVSSRKSLTSAQASRAIESMEVPDEERIPGR